MNHITSPDDLPALPDFDAAARRADLDNDSGLVAVTRVKPITRAQLDAEIARCIGIRMTVKQALS